MFRRLAMLCAGGLLVAAAGCSFKLFNNAVQVGVNVDEKVVNDSLDRVAQRIDNEMRRLGLQVVVSPEGDAVRLKSTTRGGQKFDVVLNRVRGPQGEQTNIHIDWEQAPDRELWLQLLLIAGQTALATK